MGKQKKPVRQQFLFDEPIPNAQKRRVIYAATSNLVRSDIAPLGYPPNLFDGDMMTRCISLSALDKGIWYRADADEFSSCLRDVDELVIANDRAESNNPITKAYADATLHAYQRLLESL